MKINFLKNNQKGNVLIELLAVLSILVLLTALSMPYLRRYEPNLKLSASAKDLVTDLRLAQQLTVTEQKVHKVKFDLGSNFYQVLKIDLATTTIKTVYLDPEISIQEVTDLSDNEVAFNFYGAVSESGRVVLINSYLDTAAINIRPSGFVSLE